MYVTALLSSDVRRTAGCAIRYPGSQVKHETPTNALLAGDKYLTVPEEHEKSFFFNRTFCLKVARAPHTATPAEHYAPHPRAGLRAAAQAPAR